MAKNQYYDLIPKEWYSEYKRSSTTEERKREIEEQVFKIIRSINTFPETIISFEEEIKNIRGIVTLDVYKLYKGGYIGINNVGQVICYKYYPNIYDVKKNLSGIRPISMRESFYIDRDLKRAIKANLTYDKDINGLKAWFRMSDVGYCMNFRPSAAKVIYDVNLKPNSRVLDYSSGYGGRLLGAWAAKNVVEYVGLEPNTQTYENALKFADFLNNKYEHLADINMYKECSEDFTIEKYPQYKNYFDMAFSSPPYFNLEEYSDEKTQSYHKFPDYKDWVKYYLRPTIHNCIDMLKEDGIFALNIFDIVEARKGRKDLQKFKNIKDIIQFICNEKGFKLYKIDKYGLTTRAGNGDRDRKAEKYEPIYFFRNEKYI